MAVNYSDSSIFLEFPIDWNYVLNEFLRIRVKISPIISTPILVNASFKESLPFLTVF